MWDQPEVHDVYRAWHRVLDEAGPDRMAVAEAWTQTPESMAAFVRPDELDQAFNFAWLLADWSAEAFAEVITDTLAAVEPVGASPTWVLSNHDVVRHVTRYGGGEQGLARGRAATLTMLALPGSSYLYQGEELGLEQVDVAPEDRQDPSYLRTGEVGRDGCRVPIPWGGTEAPYAFGPGAGAAVDPAAGRLGGAHRRGADRRRRGSTLAFYRDALRGRAATSPGPPATTVELLDLGADVLAFRRGPLTVVLNCGDDRRRAARRASCCWPAARSTTASCRPTPRPGCADAAAHPPGDQSASGTSRTSGRRDPDVPDAGRIRGVRRRAASGGQSSERARLYAASWARERRQLVVAPVAEPLVEAVAAAAASSPSSRARPSSVASSRIARRSSASGWRSTRPRSTRVCTCRLTPPLSMPKASDEVGAAQRAVRRPGG